MNRRRTALAGCVVLAALSGAASAGPSLPEFSLGLGFNAEAIRFGPSQAESYSLFARPIVTGFTDEFHPDNRVFVSSNNGYFDAEATSGGGGSSSNAFGAFDSLYTAINDHTGWTVAITDGATGEVYRYGFDMEGSALTSDHLRPITFTNVDQGGVISSTPTFEWTMPPSGDPGVGYADAFISLVGPVNTGTNFISPTDTSWSPAAVLTPGLYDLYLTMQGYASRSLLLTPTSLAALDGAPDLVDFSFTNTYSSFAAVYGLVVPTPAAAALLGAGALATLRRRR